MKILCIDRFRDGLESLHSFLGQEPQIRLFPFQFDMLHEFQPGEVLKGASRRLGRMPQATAMKMYTLVERAPDRDASAAPDNRREMCVSWRIDPGPLAVKACLGSQVNITRCASRRACCCRLCIVTWVNMVVSPSVASTRSTTPVCRGG
jgi:hypothetical protein